MRVLGIDPGYERLGIAIVERKDGKEHLIYSDCFKTSPKDPHYKRLRDIGEELEKVIQTHKPDSLAIETLFFNTNQKTAMSVAEARGTVLYTCARNNLKVYEYSPLQIKVAVTGNGRTDKQGVIKMIPLLISLEKEIKHDDEYDAIAAALTFLASSDSHISTA